MRYFKKYAPKQAPIWTGAGYRVDFEVPFENAEWGLLATSDGYIIAELSRLIQERRGGVAEITVFEYQDLKKKQNPLFRHREMVAPAWIARLRRAWEDGVAAAARRFDPKVMTNFNERRALGRKTGASMFRPKAVSR